MRVGHAAMLAATAMPHSQARVCLWCRCLPRRCRRGTAPCRRVQAAWHALRPRSGSGGSVCQVGSSLVPTPSVADTLSAMHAGAAWSSALLSRQPPSGSSAAFSLNSPPHSCSAVVMYFHGPAVHVGPAWWGALLHRQPLLPALKGVWVTPACTGGLPWVKYQLCRYWSAST